MAHTRASIPTKSGGSLTVLSKKRTRGDAFVHDLPEATDSHRNRRFKGIEGKEAYSVDVQTITVKKKKTTYHETTDINPPAGFAHVPIGYRKIKEQCRNECLRTQTLYYVVNEVRRSSSTGKKSKLPKRNHIKIVSDEICRIGWHFPERIVLDALDTAGAKTISEAFGARNPLLASQKPEPHLVTMDNLFDLFKDLYPAMPKEEIEHCANHAFLEEGGEGRRPRVGRSENLTYGARVQLAVNAHIRHEHTDYDKRIRYEGRPLARINIERPCVLLLIKWRGEDGEYEIEEQSREVILIDGSDTDGGNDSDDALRVYGYYGGQFGESSDPSVEVLGFRDLKQNRQQFRDGVMPEAFKPGGPSRPEWPRRVTLQGVPLSAVPPVVYNKEGEAFHFDAQSQSISPSSKPKPARHYIDLTVDSPPTRRYHARGASWGGPALTYRP